MLWLYNKKYDKNFMIFKIREGKNGYPYALIRWDNQWIWCSMKHFIDLKLTDKEDYCDYLKGDVYGYLLN